MWLDNFWCFCEIILLGQEQLLAFIHRSGKITSEKFQEFLNLQAICQMTWSFINAISGKLANKWFPKDEIARATAFGFGFDNT